MGGLIFDEAIVEPPPASGGAHIVSEAQPSTSHANVTVMGVPRGVFLGNAREHAKIVEAKSGSDVSTAD